jgi:uncharacterized protein YbcI
VRKSSNGRFGSVDERRGPGPQDAPRLTEPDWTRDVDTAAQQGPMRADISNAMVGLMKEYYGKGPTKAKSYINDNYVFCVMEGGLTRNEETLLKTGQETLVREYRLRFQEAMAGTTMEAVARITGRQVLTYHSQIVFEPERAFEIFVLDSPPRGSAPA